MLTFTSLDHTLYTPSHEYFRGERVPAFEKRTRLDAVMSALQVLPSFASGTVQSCPRSVLEQVHAPRYLDFLASAWTQLESQRGQAVEGSVFPSVWPIARGNHAFRSDVQPLNFAAQLGLYSFDTGTPLTQGSWAAASAGADAAHSAALAVASGAEKTTFVATRPPGHHAGAEYMGGYCFINNAAIAAQTLRNAGKKRVAILDVDYHHGNGTQAIFYARSDVFTLSLHASPLTDYPFFIGHADECGADDGAGYNLNLPLPQGTAGPAWFEALGAAIAAIQAAGCDALVVSLGVDTYAHDPICSFKLMHADYLSLGHRLAALALPAVIVLEGGYAIEAIGQNVAAVLAGFDS